jgi:hypothetical protein
LRQQGLQVLKLRSGLIRLQVYGVEKTQAYGGGP